MHKCLCQGVLWEKVLALVRWLLASTWFQALQLGKFAHGGCFSCVI